MEPQLPKGLAQFYITLRLRRAQFRCGPVLLEANFPLAQLPPQVGQRQTDGRVGRQKPLGKDDLPERLFRRAGLVQELSETVRGAAAPGLRSTAVRYDAMAALRSFIAARMSPRRACASAALRSIFRARSTAARASPCRPTFNQARDTASHGEASRGSRRTAYSKFSAAVAKSIRSKATRPFRTYAWANSGLAQRFVQILDGEVKAPLIDQMHGPDEAFAVRARAVR